jgi:hypothetical protein
VPGTSLTDVTLGQLGRNEFWNRVEPLLPEKVRRPGKEYTRNRRIFPNDESAMKSLYLAIREASQRWTAIHHWKPALQVFQILLGEDRVPVDR